MRYSMAKPYGPAYEKRKTKQRPLERRVLEHLKQHGPADWNMLFAFFDVSRSAAIAPVLRDLKDGGYIAIDSHSQTSITELGLMKLKAKY